MSPQQESNVNLHPSPILIITLWSTVSTERVSIICHGCDNASFPSPGGESDKHPDFFEPDSATYYTCNSSSVSSNDSACNSIPQGANVFANNPQNGAANSSSPVSDSSAGGERGLQGGSFITHLSMPTSAQLPNMHATHDTLHGTTYCGFTYNNSSDS